MPETTQKTVFEAIKTKRAVREFQDRPISEYDVNHILDAGRRAQSARNHQSWQFIVMTDRDLLARMADASERAGHLKGAACGVAVLISEGPWTLFDAGQCIAYMQLAAWELGISSGIGSFADPEKARGILHFPAEWKLGICLSLGYAAHPPAPAKAGGREPLDKLVHRNGW
ncbi:MAG TPA: nitroreductase family protein [Candidatus Xenobia bacterium]|jgi:nitroreductase